METVSLQVPSAFSVLFQFALYRYKVFYGGRGGAKSWAAACALLIIGAQRPIRVLCARELQASIGDSVHKLLKDIIVSNGLEWFYDVTQTSIKGANGTEFLFKGLKHNATEIKSTEGVDICFVEEAEKVSDQSWEVLIPTIRKEGSEIWVVFNPKNPTDPTYQRFIVRTHPDIYVRKVSWRDNPFFPSVLEAERRRLEVDDPEAYEHIWEGNFDTRYFGGVYSRSILRCVEGGRVRKGIYDPELLVHTAWDLGYDDATAIWWWQVAQDGVRVIRYYENSGEDVTHYCQHIHTIGREFGYKYGKHWVPHDAANKLLAAGGRSIVMQAHAQGVPMYVVAATSQQNQIEAARTTLESCYFDETDCHEGLRCLEQYQFEYDEDKRMFKSKPKHDWTSHAADAFEIIGQVWLKKEPESRARNEPRYLSDATFDEVMWPSSPEPTRNERI